MNFREQIEEVKPREIEERSFAIISEELGARTFAPHTELIVKRCIHTSADFDYADNLCFSQDAAVKAMEGVSKEWSLYKIDTAVDGKSTAPEGSVTLSFPCGTEELTIYRISDSGTTRITLISRNLLLD